MHKTLGPLKSEITELKLIPTNKSRWGRRVFKLEEPFIFKIHNCGINIDIEIPADFETDLASIPLICQPFIGAATEFLEEATIHDFLCDNGYPRFFANSMMRIIMEFMERPAWKQKVIFWTLMAFGYGSLPLRLTRFLWSKIWKIGKNL